MALFSTLSTRWDPWQEMARFQRDVHRLFPALTQPDLAADVPAVNLWKNDAGVVLTAEIPGLDPAELDVSVNGELVTLKGSRPVEEVPTDGRYQRRERPTGKFTRTFQLPFRVDAEKTEARYERGVLTVVLPKSAEERPQKIAVKAHLN